MKKRYTFLSYSISMTSSSLAFTLVTTIVLGLVNSFLGIGGALLTTMLPIIVCFISGVISSLLISFIASQFFRPEDIFDLKFQIVSYCIVALITLITFYLARSVFGNERSVFLIELGVASLLILVMIYAQYFSSRFLVSIVEKRKEKQI